MRGLVSYHCCEMSAYPSSLFESPDMMRHGNKSDLADAIWNVVGRGVTSEVPQDPIYVLDGSSVLHNLPWPRGVSFSELAGNNVIYVSAK